MYTTYVMLWQILDLVSLDFYYTAEYGFGAAVLPNIFVFITSDGDIISCAWYHSVYHVATFSSVLFYIIIIMHINVCPCVHRHRHRYWMTLNYGCWHHQRMNAWNDFRQKYFPFDWLYDWNWGTQTFIISYHPAEKCRIFSFICDMNKLIN